MVGTAKTWRIVIFILLISMIIEESILNPYFKWVTGGYILLKANNLKFLSVTYIPNSGNHKF